MLELTHDIDILCASFGCTGDNCYNGVWFGKDCTAFGCIGSTCRNRVCIGKGCFTSGCVGPDCDGNGRYMGIKCIGVGCIGKDCGGNGICFGLNCSETTCFGLNCLNGICVRPDCHTGGGSSGGGPDAVSESLSISVANSIINISDNSVTTELMRLFFNNIFSSHCRNLKSQKAAPHLHLLLAQLAVHMLLQRARAHLCVAVYRPLIYLRISS